MMCIRYRPCLFVFEGLRRNRKRVELRRRSGESETNGGEMAPENDATREIQTMI